MEDINHQVFIIFTNTDCIIQNDLDKIELIPPYIVISIEVQNNIKLLKVQYTNPEVIPNRFNEELNDSTVFEAITYSMVGTGNTLLQRISSYISGLPDDDLNIIKHEYSKYINDGILLDGFLAGISSYLAFILLYENGIFVNQLPFQFSIPSIVRSGNTVNHNMFQFLSLPFTALSKSTTGVLLQLILFIQSFINIWETCFTNGPIIGSSNETRMCLEIIGGLSNYTINSISQNHREVSESSLEALETHFTTVLEETANKLRRECHNNHIDQNVLDPSILKQLKKELKEELKEEFKEELKAEIQKELYSELIRKSSELETESFYLDNSSVDPVKMSAWNRWHSRRKVL